mgnify:CR=1 FL=1
MFQAFLMGIPSCVSRRAAPGLETRAILNGPSHMGESLCSFPGEHSPQDEVATSNVLEQTLWQWYHHSAYWYLADTSPTYLLFQTLLPLFWTLTCMI